MNKVIQLAIMDFKLILRDPSIRVFLLLPIILFLFILVLVPYLVEKYEFLSPYLPLFLIVGIIENTQLFCFISSMVLIDEKETQVAKVYGILPLTKVNYFISRFLLPIAITFLLNVLLIAFQPFFEFDLTATIAIPLLAALIVPIYALGINIIVKNRMEGLVYIKAFNILVLIPIGALFVPSSLEHLFGFLPTHWLFQSIENAALGMDYLFNYIVGAVFSICLLYYLFNQFTIRHFE